MAKIRQEMTEDTPPPPPQPVEQVDNTLEEVAQVAVSNWSDGNFALGVNLPSHYPTAVVLLDCDASQVRPGDTVALPGVKRKVTSVMPTGTRKCAVFLEGAHLNPATQGYPAVASIRRPATFDFAVQPSVVVAPLDFNRNLSSGGLGAVLDAAGSGLSQAASAASGVVGGAVNAVGDVAGAGIDAARNSVLAQTALAIATGGLSLVAQAAGELATGSEGPVTGTIKKAVEDPGDFLSELPGVVLTQTGLPGLVFDAARVGGKAVEAAFGDDSAVGRVAGQVAETAAGVQQAARDNPVASLEIAAGTALLAIGVPGGKNLLNNGLGGLLGGGTQPTSTEPEAGEVQAPATAADPAPSRMPAKGASSWSFLDVVAAVGSLGLVPAYRWGRRAAA